MLVPGPWTEDGEGNKAVISPILMNVSCPLWSISWSGEIPPLTQRCSHLCKRHSCSQAPRSWGEVGHLVIRAYTRMSRGWIVQGLPNCTGTATWENVQPSSPLVRGVCISVKKADGQQASKHRGWTTRVQKIRCSPDLSFKFTVCWTKGYVEIVPLNLGHQKRLCFLLKGFCNAAHSSSPKAGLTAKPIFMVRLQNKCKIALASDELSLSLATGTPSASWVGTVNTVG